MADEDVGRMLWAAKEVILQQARIRFDRYVSLVVRDRDQALELDHLQLAWLAHAEFCWQHDLYVGIFTPSKTSSFAALLGSWMLGRYPGKTTKLVTGSESSARLALRVVKGIVSSPRYGTLFPDAQLGRWTDHTLYSEQVGHAIEPAFEAAAFTTKAAGAGIDTLIFDQALDTESGSTPERREAGKRTIANLWLPRLNPGARLIWLSARTVPDDAAYALRQRPDFCWLEQQDVDGVWEQEVYNAPASYLDDVRVSLLSLAV